MTTEREKTFIGRWSLRKGAARRGEELPEPVRAPAPHEEAKAPTPPAVAAESGEVPELPSLESLEGLASEYREFMRPDVDESIRRAAMKKLFADPHFNVMDGLDVYIDDYGKPDPLPQAMVRAMVQSRGLFLFDDDAKQPGDPAVAAPQQEGAPQEPPESSTAMLEDASDGAECPEDGTLSQTEPQPVTRPVEKG